MLFSKKLRINESRLEMIKGKFIIVLLLAVFFSGLTAGAVTIEAKRYLTRDELAKIIAEAAGEKKDAISEFMFSKGLTNEATMEDLIEILFQAGLLDNDVKEDKTFIGKPIIKIYK
jgi:hypothetical protein